jgi:hypothetical protein
LDDRKDGYDNNPEGGINEMRQDKQVFESVSEAIGKPGPKGKSLPIHSYDEKVHRHISKATAQDPRPHTKPIPEIWSLQKRVDVLQDNFSSRNLNLAKTSYPIPIDIYTPLRHIYILSLLLSWEPPAAR